MDGNARNGSSAIMNNNFTKSMEFILSWEVGPKNSKNWETGGYNNHPRDPGGETKFGISKRAHPELDIKNLTLEKAMEIYYQDYWKTTGCDLLEMPLATCVINTAIMSGPKKAIKLMDETKDWKTYLYYFKVFLVNLNRPDFLKGWLNRLNDLDKFCTIYDQDHPTGP